MIVFVRFLYMFAYILISIQYIQGTSLPAAFWRTIQDLNKQSRVAVDFPTAESRNFPISWNRVTEAAISCWPSHWWGTSQRIISQEDRTFESFEFSANFFFPECVARVPVSLWGSGSWGCVRSTLRSRAQPSATVRARTILEWTGNLLTSTSSNRC